MCGAHAEGPRNSWRGYCPNGVAVVQKYLGLQLNWKGKVIPKHMGKLDEACASLNTGQVWVGLPQRTNDLPAWLVAGYRGVSVASR